MPVAFVFSTQVSVTAVLQANKTGHQGAKKKISKLSKEIYLYLFSTPDLKFGLSDYYGLYSVVKSATSLLWQNSD